MPYNTAVKRTHLSFDHHGLMQVVLYVQGTSHSPSTPSPFGHFRSIRDTRVCDGSRTTGERPCRSCIPERNNFVIFLYMYIRIPPWVHTAFFSKLTFSSDLSIFIKEMPFFNVCIWYLQFCAYGKKEDDCLEDYF